METVKPLNVNDGTNPGTSTDTNADSVSSHWTIYYIGGAIVICFVLFVIWYFLIHKPVQVVSTSVHMNTATTLSNIPLTGSNTMAIAPTITPPPTAANPVGCFVDKPERAMPDMMFGDDKTYVTFEKCKQGAMDGSWKYFALQNLSTQPDGQHVGQCFASNDLTKLQQYGRATNCTPIIGTDKHAGTIWSNYVYTLEDTPKAPLTVKQVGCYKDADNRAMSDWVLGNTNSTIDECQQGAMYKGLKYFGLQNYGMNNGRQSGVCYGTNNEQAAKQYGVASNCSAIPGTDKMGGLGYANYIYEQS